MTKRSRSAETKLREFVEAVAVEHPPLSVDSVDLDVRNPELVRSRYGPVFAYLTRVELEVERNVLELRTMLPNPTEVDRLFYEDVWSPQELQHGVILDTVQSHLAISAAPADVANVSGRIKLVGLLSHLPGMSKVVRLLYYLTGAATEKAAVLAYSRLLNGLRAMGEHALAETVVAPIRRQEPAHFAFYRRSAESLIHEEGMRDWQLELTRILRRRSFGLVGANNDGQRADFGAVATALGMDRDLHVVARQFSLVERQLLWARDHGMDVPDYIMRALREALTLHSARIADPQIA